MSVSVLFALNYGGNEDGQKELLFTTPLYKDLSWESMNNDADWIVQGSVKSHQGRYVSIPGDNEETDRYSNWYYLEINRLIKGDLKGEELKISVLEDMNSHLEVGDEFLFFLKETKPGYIVPIAKEHGMFNIKNGMAVGYFINNKFLENSVTWDENLGTKARLEVLLCYVVHGV